MENQAIKDFASVRDDYAALLEEHSLKYTIDNHYLICKQAVVEDYIKVYLSVVISQLPTLLQLMTPEFVQLGLGFGMVKNQSSAKLVLNGYLGAEHVGKVVIVFVPNGMEGLLQRLVRLTADFYGPRVPGMVQLNDCVFIDRSEKGEGINCQMDHIQVPIDAADPAVSFIAPADTGKEILRQINDAHEDIGADTVIPVSFIDQIDTRQNTSGQCNPVNRGSDNNSVLTDQAKTGSKIKTKYRDVSPAERNKKPRIQVLADKYIVLSELKSDPKGDVLKALYLNKYLLPVWCIIKEGKKYMVSDSAGRDMDDRLNWQQHIYYQLASVVHIPKVFELFQQDGNTYLVMEWIRGISLRKVIDRVYKGRSWKEITRQDKIKLLELLLEMIQMIDRIHTKGFLHRDISTANFLVGRKGKIYLIDWELAFDLNAQYPLPPFGFGTPGFMSPEQNLGRLPSVKEDIYGLSALMLVFFTGIRVKNLSKEVKEDMTGFVYGHTGMENITGLIGRGLDKEAANRPGLEEIREQVRSLIGDLVR
ncbi:serine/threonine protein kinase [Pedobacter sp. KBW01]|uniref:serine/threonine protein kinase n=1 Tax=Pedobacter sp. KBW01 TaxID=2153364 RepID=UPI001319F46B|nr:protein kinase [Pedobacter sp. KBW01]